MVLVSMWIWWEITYFVVSHTLRLDFLEGDELL